jgi:hypothetical protein
MEGVHLVTNTLSSAIKQAQAIPIALVMLVQVSY